MSYGTGGGDGATTLLVVGVIVVVLAGVGWWYAQGQGGANPQSSMAAPGSPEGPVPCPSCSATGKTWCGKCAGYGRVNYWGKGVAVCNGCGGAKKIVCWRCKGACQVVIKPGDPR
jgi:hypothetical protein